MNSVECKTDPMPQKGASFLSVLAGGAFLGAACSLPECFQTIQFNANYPGSSLLTYLAGSWCVYAVIGACLAGGVAVLGAVSRQLLSPRIPQIWPPFTSAGFFLGLWAVEAIGPRFVGGTATLWGNVAAWAAMGLVWVGTYAVLATLARYFPVIRRTWPWSLINCLGLLWLVSLVLFRAPRTHGVLDPVVFSLVISVLLLAAGPCIALAARRRPLYLGGTVAVFIVVVVTLIGGVGLSGRQAHEPHAREHAPNVVLISIDTLRADHLSLYGYGKHTTPRINSFAKDAVVFETAIAETPKTSPSHISMLTGLHPFNHGVVKNGSMLLKDEAETLSELLSAEGYDAAGFVSGFTLTRTASPLFKRFPLYDDALGPWGTVLSSIAKNRFPYGFSRLVLRRHWRHLGVRGGYDRPAGRTVDEAIRWLNRKRHAPFFLFIHLFDPHGGYVPPQPYDRMHAQDDLQREADEKSWHGDWQDTMSASEKERAKQNPKWLDFIVSQYDGEISYADHHVGRLLTFLEDRKLIDETIIVITADHGESLGQHRAYFAHADVYDGTVRVPLVIRLPGEQEVGIRPAPVELTDIAPTILNFLGIVPGATLDGRSLSGYCRNADNAPEERPIVSYVINGESSMLLAFRDGAYKYIIKLQYDEEAGASHRTEEIYDLASDPRELTNLANSEPELLRRYGAAADPHWQRLNALSGEVDGIDAATVEQLEGLGYL